MRAKLIVKNYRSFSEAHPAVIEIGSEFTAFIGPNNAGKSNLLKLFYEIRSPLQKLSYLDQSNNADTFLRHELFDGEIPHRVNDPYELVRENAASLLQVELRIESVSEGDKNILKAVRFTFYPAGGFRWGITLLGDDGRPIQEDGRNVKSLAIQDGRLILKDGSSVSLAPMAELARSLGGIKYIGPFRNAINEGGGGYYDLQVGTAFVRQWHSWKTGPIKAQNRAISRATEDIRRLMGVASLEIGAAVEQETLHLVINGRPHKLSEVGSGIAQLIVVLGNVLIGRPSYVAIDEPETHLHPALQLDFLTTLASYATDGVFFATHSIGLARSIADRLYSVQAGEGGSIVREYSKTPRYAEFLGSLGIAGLQDIGWDTVLLVEGTHDVRTFQQWLRKYGLERKVVVLPLGGSSMIHGGTTEQLTEVVRLTTGRVMAIIDSERKSADAKTSKERLAFKNNCDKLDIRCLITNKRATENYLTGPALRLTFDDRYSALGDYETSEGAAAFWGKADNWRVAANMTKAELDGTDIGAFLAQLVQ